MKIIIFDIETYTENNIIKFGVGIAKDLNKDFYIFKNKENMVNFLLAQKKEKTIFMGHNIFGFDLPLLFGYKDLFKKFQVILDENKIYSIFNKDKKIYFIDTYNIFPVALARLGQEIKLQKLNTLKSLGTILNKDTFYSNIKDIIYYCKQDVLINEKVVINLLELMEKYKIKKIPFTNASLSLKFFKSYLQHKYKFYKFHTDKNDIRFLLSYYGGRSEAFYLGKYTGSVFVFDYNSLYPSVMINNFYPSEYIATYKNPAIKDFYNFLMNYEGMAIVKVKTKNTFGFYDQNNNFINIGLLPYKYKNKIYYPSGKWIGAYNFNELRYILKFDYDIEPIQVSIYKRSDLSFIKDYIYDIYDKKQNDKEYKYMWKIILNSLYGKFGQLNSNYNIKIINNNEFFDIIEKNQKNKHVIVNEGKNETILKISSNKKRTKHTMFNLYSYITSYARLRLYEAFEKAINKGGMIFYTDTDSIFTNVFLENNKNIGRLKLEQEGDSIEIYGQKAYQIYKNGEIIKRKTKGIPLKAELLYKKSHIEYYKYNNILKYKTAFQKDINELQHINVIKKLSYTTKRADQINLNSFQKIKTIEADNNVILDLNDIYSLYKFFNIQY